MPDTASVLVVDDDPLICDLLRDYLAEHGYEVRTAGDCSAARALLAEQVPQLVLLDVGLPGEDGLSLARHLRENYDLGIVMLSGASDTVDRLSKCNARRQDHKRSIALGMAGPVKRVRYNCSGRYSRTSPVFT